MFSKFQQFVFSSISTMQYNYHQLWLRQIMLCIQIILISPMHTRSTNWVLSESIGRFKCFQFLNNIKNEWRNDRNSDAYVEAVWDEKRQVRFNNFLRYISRPFIFVVKTCSGCFHWKHLLVMSAELILTNYAI